MNFSQEELEVMYDVFSTLGPSLGKTLPENIAPPAFITTTEVTEAIETDAFVHIRFIKNEDGEWELALIINEYSTSQQLRNAWRTLHNYVKALSMLQGTHKGGMIKYYYQKKKGGMSYRKIAEEFNYHLLLMLTVDASGTESERAMSLIYTAALLQEWGINYKDSSVWAETGMKNIQSGRLPWTPQTGPVDALRVRDALRYWEKWVDQNLLKDTPLPDWVPFGWQKRDTPELTTAIALIEKLEKTGQ